MRNIILPTLMLVLLFVGCHCSTKAGLKLRITNKGLEYINSIADDFLADQLNKLRIPDQSGTSGRLNWWIMRIENRGATTPDSRMSYHPGYNGFSWALSNFGINLHSHFRAKYKKGWFKVSTSGRVDLKIQRLSLLVTARLGTQVEGLPSMTMSRCTASVGNVDVKFHGGISFILNLFRRSIGKRIRRLMEGQVCTLVRKVINEDANREMRKMKFNVEVGKNFILDYSLVKPPTVYGDNVEFQHKGEVFWKGEKNQPLPFSPREIPHLGDVSRMLYLWVTDYSANSFSQVAFENILLSYTMTKDFFPPEYHSYLSTTCDMFCIGNFIPEIGMVYPDSSIEISAEFLKAPVLSILPDVMTVFAEASVKIYVRTPDDQRFDLIQLHAKPLISVYASVVEEKITAEVVDCKLEIDSVESKVGEIYSDDLTAILQLALDVAGIPHVNNVLRKGIDLPVTGLVYFQNTELVLLNGSLVIATDVSTQLRFQRPQKPIPKVEGSIISEKYYMSRLNKLSQQRHKSVKEYKVSTDTVTQSSTKNPTTSSTKPPEISTTTKAPLVSTTKQPVINIAKEPIVSTTKTPEFSAAKEPHNVSTTQPPKNRITEGSISTLKSPAPDISTTKGPIVSTEETLDLSTTNETFSNIIEILELNNTESILSPHLLDNSTASNITTINVNTTTETTFPPDHISHFLKDRKCLTEEEMTYLSTLDVCSTQT